MAEDTNFQRPSIVLRCHHRKNSHLLSMEEGDMASQIGFRGGTHLRELKRAARSTNRLIRAHYGEFIHEVGRNVYPLIVFTDHEADGPSGVGSTLTLYRADGSVTKVSPAAGTNYELYKCCSHLFMGLAVEIGPYLRGDVICSRDENNGGRPEPDEAREMKGCAKDVFWRRSLTEYVEQVRVFLRAFIHAAEVEAGTVNKSSKECSDLKTNKLAVNSKEDGKKQKKHSVCSSQDETELPSAEMQETISDMLVSVVEFCEHCLSVGALDIQRWRKLNYDNFRRIKLCMKMATEAQADACVNQLVQWRDMLGPEEWRELHVVIPAVWAVAGENPRKSMLRQLMDEDRVDTHIIVSEHPRDHAEARTLLGRVVGDRAIGRFVFGDETKERRAKTMGLGSDVDVVQDDALPAIWSALRKLGCPVRRHRGTSDASSTGSECMMAVQNLVRQRRSSTPSFCS